MAKFKRDVCEVCHEPVIDISQLSPELREEVYVPEKGESYYKETVVQSAEGFTSDDDEIEVPIDGE